MDMQQGQKYRTKVINLDDRQKGFGNKWNRDLLPCSRGEHSDVHFSIAWLHHVLRRESYPYHHGLIECIGSPERIERCGFRGLWSLARSVNINVRKTPW